MSNSTRVRMLDTTARLLQNRGYHGAALSEILEESGATRGSLYFHFPGGKDELVLEATKRGVDETTAAFREVLSNARSPAKGIRAFIELAAEYMHGSNYTFGCPVAPVILDATSDMKELAALCRKAFDEWIGLTEAALRDAGLPKKRAHALAVLVESALEGGLLMSRAYRDTAPLLAVAAELETAINAALPKRRSQKSPK